MSNHQQVKLNTPVPLYITGVYQGEFLYEYTGEFESIVSHQDHRGNEFHLTQKLDGYYYIVWRPATSETYSFLQLLTAKKKKVSFSAASKEFFRICKVASKLNFEINHLNAKSL